jgi:tRNA-dihydrouridine synthase B
VGIQALAVHGRTRKQMYKGEADWTLIGKIKENPRVHIPIFGNGDIDSPEKAVEYKNRYGVDGVMIGRASIGNPWIFKEIKHYIRTGEILPAPGISDRVEAARRHLEMSLEWKGVRQGVVEMRRHYASYFRNYPGIKKFRATLVTEDDPSILFETLIEIENTYINYEMATAG